MAQRTFSQKFWEDKNGKFVVWQAPNIWLKIWIVTLLLGWFLPIGTLQRINSWVSLISLIVWAAMETTTGVNYFRRALGVLVLLWLVLVRI